MKHSLASIPSNIRPTFFISLLILTIAVMVALQFLGQPLRTTAAPAGIISYEFAGDSETADAILNSWDEDAKILAGFNLGLDYLFLVAYSTTIALAILWTTAAWSFANWLIAAATMLAWGQWLAAVLDSVENAVLMIMLVETTSSPWPELAHWCAMVKFGLVAIGLLFVVVMVIFRLFRGRPQN